MEPLIKITTVPTIMEIKNTPARLQYKNASADLQISRGKGGMQIKTSPIRISIDTFEAKNSIAPTTRTSIEQAAAAGKQAAYEATAAMAEQGYLLLHAKIGDDTLSRVLTNNYDAQYTPNEFTIGFIPTAAPEIEWSEPSIDIQYQMDKLRFDWQTNHNGFEFVPGNFEIKINQYPDVIIEYVGGPIYVPASADPNYVPLDTRA